LGRCALLLQQLLLGLLVAVHDELVEKAAGLPVRVVGGLGLLNLLVEVTGGFLVYVLRVMVFVDVDWTSLLALDISIKG